MLGLFIVVFEGRAGWSTLTGSLADFLLSKRMARRCDVVLKALSYM
jgi:hypothetical protein